MKGRRLLRRLGVVLVCLGTLGAVIVLTLDACGGGTATTSTGVSGGATTSTAGVATSTGPGSSSGSTVANPATTGSVPVASTTAPPASGTTSSYPPAAQSDYTILAANDLGMHCIQPEYSAMMILPPANFLHVQVFRKGGEGAQLVTGGITVEYAVNNLGDPSTHSNFWQYAKDYGFSVDPGKGITGNGLTGSCTLSQDGKYWEATAIPVVPYDAQGNFNAYPTCTVTVKDQSGKVLAVQPTVVVPVSDEMHCDNCHEKTNTFASILGAHDRLSNTTLAADLAQGKRHACNECHADNVLGAKGQAGVKSLSEAMHGFHAAKMATMNTLQESCYNCHPGQKTQCLRGAMAAAGLTCDDAKCHGSIDNVASTIASGRQPWLNEPDCGNCHKNAANANTLYRLSYLMNGPEDMNGFILCESCHNGTHSEWKSMLALDNSIPIYLQGKAGPIGTCTVCHQGSGQVHGGGGGGG
jgi:hypothetical protein